MSGVIRSATLADVDAIVAVHVAGFQAGNAPHLISEQADRMTPARSGAAWRALYVDPERSGAGHGTALDGGARERLAAHAFGQATLWVLERNEPARGFYERRGWRADGERRDHLGSTTLRYRVEL